MQAVNVSSIDIMELLFLPFLLSDLEFVENDDKTVAGGAR